MKKAIGAAVMLALLFIGAAWNIRHLDRMTEDLIETVERSRHFSSEKRYDDAMETLRTAIDTWNEADGYTHVFIRHVEIDAATDAFYEALAALQAEEAEDAAFDKLIAHLNSIDTMEHITWKSVF